MDKELIEQKLQEKEEELNDKYLEDAFREKIIKDKEDEPEERYSEEARWEKRTSSIKNKNSKPTEVNRSVQRNRTCMVEVQRKLGGRNSKRRHKAGTG